MLSLFALLSVAHAFSPTARLSPLTATTSFAPRSIPVPPTHNGNIGARKSVLFSTLAAGKMVRLLLSDVQKSSTFPFVLVVRTQKRSYSSSRKEASQRQLTSVPILSTHLHFSSSDDESKGSFWSKLKNMVPPANERKKLIPLGLVSSDVVASSQSVSSSNHLLCVYLPPSPPQTF